MSTQHAKTTDALRSSPMACHCGVVPSLQSTLRLSPPLLLPASRAGLGAALPERPCSLQDEPKSAHTPSCAGRTAAGSLSLLSRLVGVGVPRPLPLSACWPGAVRGLRRHPRALPPSQLLLSAGLRSSPSLPRALSPPACCPCPSPAQPMLTGSYHL